MGETGSGGFGEVARTLIGELRPILGDEEAERAALQRAVDGLQRLAKANGDGRPLEELMIPERLCEDAFDGHRSVVELAAGEDEDAELRLREAIADLCGY